MDPLENQSLGTQINATVTHYLEATAKCQYSTITSQRPHLDGGLPGLTPGVFVARKQSTTVS
jgi:hypothetical protein